MLPYQPHVVAEAVLQLLDRAAADRGRATLAIPGGRSPGPVLAHLAGIMDDFLRPRLHLLWLDERAVPQGHPDRNDAPTLHSWAQGGALPGHVHPMPAEASDLATAAVTYGNLLETVTQGHGLDVALVGIGEDGHIASLFPNHPGLKEISPVFVVDDSPKPPPRRLTVSLAVLHQAHHLFILALGAAKGLIAARAGVGDADPIVTSSLPVSLLPPDRCQWYLDDAALAAWRSLRG